MRKIIDQNGRLFGLISIIDVIVILVVAVMALAFLVKQNTLTPAVQGSISTTSITYTGIVRNLSDELVDDIQVGDSLFDHDQVTNGSIGTITNIEVTPAVRTVYLPDGTVAQAVAENYSDVTITVQAEANIVEGHYRFNNVYELGVNANRNLYTPFVLFTMVVTSIGATE